jgi:hypothetical protein
MPSTVPDFQLRQASVDPDDQSEFRILVDRKFVKYLIIDPGLYDVDDMCFGPSSISIIPPLLSGDWNKVIYYGILQIVALILESRMLNFPESRVFVIKSG